MSMNESDEQLKFDTPQDEIDYLKKKLDENQKEFQEFQESSQELETEYETQIKQLEKKNDELSIQLSRLEDENEQLRTRYNVYANDTQHKLNECQRQIGEYTALNDRLTSYIRELEQNNDDLERAQRALAASLEDFESQLNQQIERNVLLENEVSEKEELECVVQRLKEEARDLRHELIVNKNSNESARRKQLLLDSYAQRDSSLISIGNQIQEITENTTMNHNNTHLDDSTTSKDVTTASNIQITSDESQKPPVVDSTTSPMTPTQNTSRFSFSSPFSGSGSSLSKSTETKSQQTSNPSSPKLPPIVMTPSSRISALNIVSDLLRKVGALESKLASTKKVAS